MPRLRIRQAEFIETMDCLPVVAIPDGAEWTPGF